MQLDYVDIFYHHRMDPETPLEETILALDQIVRSGKALYAGISNYDGEHAKKALEIAKEIQGTFDSWDSFVQSYLEGYEESTGDSSDDREELYQNLKASQWNPYSVSWKTKLKKNW